MINAIKTALKDNKKGVTLVELVFGVVVLSIFAIGIITSLTAANTKIAQNAKEATAHAEATQMLDAAIAIISNGDYDAKAYEGSAVDVDGSAIEPSIKAALESMGYSGFDLDMTVKSDYIYVNANNENKVRGWKVALTYNDTTVTGYASNTKGVFDRVEDEDDDE